MFITFKLLKFAKLYLIRTHIPMLQAVIHNKSTVDICEDTLTSSVIGVMQFLPDDLFWSLLAESCGTLSQLPKTAGRIIKITFWPKFFDNTFNSKYVEPDVWIEAEDYNIIIEAKKTDCGGQYEEQWKKEITAIKKKVNNNKAIIFISLGGNTSLTDCKCTMWEEEHCIYTASWFNLLHAVNKLYRFHSGELPRNQLRTLSAIIAAFSKHSFYDVEWFSEFRCASLPFCNTKCFNELLEFDNHCFFEELYTPTNKLNRSNIFIWEK